MTSELKPCPFCGGEPTAIETRPWRGELYCGNCDVVLGGNNAMTAEELTEAWNTRAERTCRNVNEGHSFTCSECGDCTFNPFPEIMPLLKLNYCPNCGAKVTEEDTDG